MSVIEKAIKRLNVAFIEFEDNNALIDYFKSLHVSFRTELATAYEQRIRSFDGRAHYQGFYDRYGHTLGVKSSLTGQPRKRILIHEVGHAILGGDRFYIPFDPPYAMEKYWGAAKDEERTVDEFSRRVLSSLESLEPETEIIYEDYRQQFMTRTPDADLEHTIEELVQRWDKLISPFYFIHKRNAQWTTKRQYSNK